MEHKEHEDEVSKTLIQNSIPAPNISNPNQVRNVDGELKNNEFPHVINEDSTMEVTHDPNHVENKDEKLEEEMLPHIITEDLLSYQHLDGHIIMPLA